MFTLKPLALVSLLTLLLLLSTLSVRNMDQVNFNISLKNIPIPTKKEFLSELISSVGIFVANLKWRSFHFLNPSNTDRKETFGFKTTEPAPSVAELKDFENYIYDLQTHRKNYISPISSSSACSCTHFAQTNLPKRVAYLCCFRERERFDL